MQRGRREQQTQSRFSAFFLFSAPVEPADVAERLTAFVVFGSAGPVPHVPPPTLALAVPSGEGDVMRSLLSLSLDSDIDVGSVFAGDDWRGWDGGAGDFLVEGVDEMDNVVGGSARVGVDVAVGVDTASGVSNSTGFVRGVACTLVINFALEQ
jgi:hypothetical protein